MQYVLTLDVNRVITVLDPLIYHVLDLNPEFSIESLMLGFAGYLSVKYNMLKQTYTDNDDIEMNVIVHIRDVYFFPNVDIELITKTYQYLLQTYLPEIEHIIRIVIQNKESITGVESYWNHPLINHHPCLIFNSL